MKESQAIVQRVRLLDNNLDYQELELAIAESLSGIKHGQCVLARPKSLRKQHIWHPYMRTAWYPTHISRKKMIVQVHSTESFGVGDVIDVFGPVGQSIPFRRTLRNVLLLAYDTQPFPLLMTIPYLIGRQTGITLVLLGKAANYPTRHLPPEIEVIRGDDPDNLLSWQNQVITIGWADQVLAVVPPGDELTPFEKIWTLFKQRRADISSKYIYGVSQNVLPCGVGACDACMVRTKEGDKLACVDGPALDLFQIFG